MKSTNGSKNMTNARKSKYKIEDTGKRCFAPPCYNISVLDEKGMPIALVHAVIYEGRKLDLGNISDFLLNKERTLIGEVVLEEGVLLIHKISG